MRFDSGSTLRVKSGSFLPPLAIAAISLPLAQIATLLVFGHSRVMGVLSDGFLLVAPLFATVVCLLTSRRSYGIARPFWLLAGATFASWFIGKCLLTYDDYYLGINTIRIVPLLFFFVAGAPMFVAVFLSDDDFGETISWEWILDTVQIVSLSVVIYLFVVYIPLLRYGEQVVSPLEDLLLLWRNILLTAGLLTRSVFSRLRYVRHLYLPVACAMGVFTVATWFANRAEDVSRGPDTAWYELSWSVPFCMVTLAAALWKEIPEKKTVQPEVPVFSRVIFAYLPSLALPVMLLVKYKEVVRAQIFLGLFGLMFSIVLFNARLVLTLRRQRRTAGALLAAEHQYRSLFERAMAGVVRSTLDGRILDCNDAYASMMGYTREELRSIPASRLYFGGEEERSQYLLKLRRDDQSGPNETRLRRKDGSELWVLHNANIERYPDGSEVLEGTLVDITERKQTNLAVEAWKRRYDDAVLASRQIIHEWDLDANRVTVGGCVFEILGYSPEELSGDSRLWLAVVHQDDTVHYAEQCRVALITHEPVDFEYRAQRRNAGYRILRHQGSAVLDRTGRAVRLVGFISDITEQRALEAQLRQAQKMEAVGRLAGGVAHDFNNLLTVISGYGAMQLEHTDQSNPVHHQAEQIMAATERAAALTRQLLAFSRQQVMQPRRVNLNEIVHKVDPMLRRLIGEDIEILTVLAGDLGTVKVDPGQVDQVLMNLVVNARDAMPNGGKLTIQTENVDLNEDYAKKHEYVSSGRYVLLAVTDNGVGMDPETQARIFEPFFTTKEQGKGTGLGLPMVYGIVKQSGGHIEVYSEKNRGTTIKVYLPRVDEAAEEARSALDHRSTGGSERILLVEDDQQLRELVTEILAGRGYNVRAIEKIEELDAVIQQDGPCDLLLTDVIMPKMSGPEVAARVARQWPRIKVLYMSGYTSDAIVHHGILDHGLSFLQKPFTPTALVAKVREVLDVPSRP